MDFALDPSVSSHEHQGPRLSSSREVMVFRDGSLADDLMSGFAEGIGEESEGEPQLADVGLAEEEGDITLALEKAILEPLRYQADVNKRARSGERYIDLLIHAFSREGESAPSDRAAEVKVEQTRDSPVWLVCSAAARRVIRRVCLELYVACCMVEDISSEAQIRRGVPSASAIYGVPLTLNCANQGFFLAMKGCIELDEMLQKSPRYDADLCPSAIDVFTDELLRMHRGQGNDIRWRDSHKCPTLEDYYEMLVDRAGAIPRLAVRLLQQHSLNEDAPSVDALLPLTNEVALFLALSEDYSSFARALSASRGERATIENVPGFSKAEGAAAAALAVAGVSAAKSTNPHQIQSDTNDGNTHALAEGRFTLPTIHCIREAMPGDRRLSNILALDAAATNEGLRAYALSFLEETGSLEFTKRRALDRAELVIQSAEGLGSNLLLVQIIREITARRLQ